MDRVPACGRVSGREMAERFVVIEYALGRELLLGVGDNELVAQQFGRAGGVFVGDDGRIDLSMPPAMPRSRR